MFNFEKFSNKTYYAMLVASAGLGVISEMLRLILTGIFGFPVIVLLGNISYIIFGGAMLMLCGGFGSAGVLNKDRGTQLGAMFLAIASLMPTPIPFGALVWPCFAFPYILKKINPLYKLALVVLVADFASITFAFILKGTFYYVVAVLVNIVHLIFAYTLFTSEKKENEPPVSANEEPQAFEIVTAPGEGQGETDEN